MRKLIVFVSLLLLGFSLSALEKLQVKSIVELDQSHTSIDVRDADAK
ncbi:MAG: hypothetical protein JXR56_07530 [Candidatus Cloacimonetes bacterium]|nr:hypothetical protein [Candidatus Cloacimonadota bacterium]